MKKKFTSIKNSYNTGSVSASGFRNGGLAGTMGKKETISNSYNFGSVTGSQPNGGIVGAESGSSATYSNNYFDSDNTGTTVASGIGGSAKTTSEMMMQTTFTGWDFGAVWSIDSGTYPYLRTIRRCPSPVLKFIDSKEL